MTANYLVTKHILSAQLKVPHVRGAPFQADGCGSSGYWPSESWEVLVEELAFVPFECSVEVGCRTYCATGICATGICELAFVPSECSVEVGSYVA